MSRFFITLSYNGTNYVGWQIQPNGPTLQQKIEEAFSTILRSDIAIVGAGRTDSGVHAVKMVAHFDWDGDQFSADDLIGQLNGYLPKDILILSIREVKPDAHARFSAISRTYRYYLTTTKDPFLHQFRYRVNFSPDIEKMNQLSAILMEYDDFTSFSKLHSDTKTNICRVEYVGWEKKGDSYIFTIRANRFLRNMVRAIAGTLLQGGRGVLDENGLRHIIEAKNRQLAGDSVPGHALFLEDVLYPDDIWL